VQTEIPSVCGRRRIFSAGDALQPLEIHKVFLRGCAFPRQKISRRLLLPMKFLLA
jgi:hypothetical protein